MDLDWLGSPVWRLAAALGLGLLIGAERERRKGEGPGRAPAGIRTFALTALLGGVGALGGVLLLGITAAFVAALALLAYALSDRRDPGMTSETALMGTFALGALAQREPGLALGTGVSITVLLAARTSLHAFVRDTLSTEELRDALVLGVAALIVLPVLPNRAIDPLEVLNPFTLWRLAVVLMAVNATGHILRRAVGPRYGLALAGFASGFVSSLATVAAMGTRARAQEEGLRGAAAGAAASSVATFVQAAVLIGTVSTTLLLELVWPLLLGGLAALAYAVWLAWRASQGSGPPEAVAGRAFDLRTALGFAALVSLVASLASLVGRLASPAAVLVTAALAGLVDGHAASASVVTLGVAGELGPAEVRLGVVLALSTNTLMKAVLAYWSGPRAYARSVSLGLAALLAGLWGGAGLALLRG